VAKKQSTLMKYEMTNPSKGSGGLLILYELMERSDTLTLGTLAQRKEKN
jgi:hypothetical protein